MWEVLVWMQSSVVWAGRPGQLENRDSERGLSRPYCRSWCRETGLCSCERI